MIEDPNALGVAKLVSFWHLSVGGYLVIFSERNSPLLMAIALLKALLGGCIYLLIIQPGWSWLPPLEGVVLPLTLVLLILISFIVTYLVWRHYDLQPPQERLKDVALDWAVTIIQAVERHRDDDD